MVAVYKKMLINWRVINSFNSICMNSTRLHLSLLGGIEFALVMTISLNADLIITQTVWVIFVKKAF